MPRITASPRTQESLERRVPKELQSGSYETTYSWIRQTLTQRLTILVAANELRYYFSQYTEIFEFARIVPYIEALEHFADYWRDTHYNTIRVLFPDFIGPPALINSQMARLNDVDPIEVAYGYAVAQACAILRIAGQDLMHADAWNLLADGVTALLRLVQEWDDGTEPAQALAQGLRLTRYLVPLSEDWSIKWHTTNTTALASTMYEERLWANGPILLDALMDVECENTKVLIPLRFPNQLGRGLYVIDKLAGYAEEMERYSGRKI